MKSDNQDKNSYLLSFDQNWVKAKEKEQLELIEKALKLAPGQGIHPVLAGMNSFYFSVREKSKQVLLYFKTKLFGLMENYSCDEEFLYALKESALFSAGIYNALSPNLSAQEIRFYCEVLLESGGRGPFYAWKLWQMEGVSQETLKNIALAVSEKGRFFLVDQYLHASPVVRKKFAGEFKKILKSIEHHKNVISFYAWLFDNDRYIDPFFFHLNAALINTDLIVSKYINASVPEFRAQGIKALSMIVPRIDPSFLINFFSETESPMVRITALKVVRNSPGGTYPELFDHIYKLICKPEALKSSEAWEGFRALVACRRSSLSELIRRLAYDIPHFMTELPAKISSLSGFSFFFIRDMAEDNIFDNDKLKNIYKALVCGMIKKRPERILKILEKYKKFSDEEVRMAVIQLSSRISESLSREKQAINMEFSQFKIKPDRLSSADSNRNIIKSIFSDSVDKKIKMIKKKTFYDDIDFKGETIANADFSSGLFANLIIFNKSIIRDSDLSCSSFLNSVFKESVFLNVNLENARFEGISFDNAVFIDVNAGNAEFIRCSFNGASFFNTSFKSADMQGSVFIDSVISRVSFSRADLSDASFACSKISSVSFTESHLFNTDFTGIRSRLSRFPSHSNLNIAKDYADFNARLFNFDENFLPDSLFNLSNSANSLVSDINMMIFAESIHFGKQMFLRQNKFSILTAIDIFKTKPADLFEIIPLLVHENIDFPGYDAAGEKSPYGISGYFPSHETGMIAAKYLPKESLSFRTHRDCYVESLFTMGSTGSIAQSFDSDIDYWVCIRDDDYIGKQRLKFQRKLEKLETWAFSSFKIEIHFFIVDIEKAKNDDFGASSSESSGSAQGKILKEEFYRTMIYVAGKLPLWCVLPVSISRKYYDKLYSMICVTPDSCRYIDLGDIHEIPPGEYLGASIWQMFKWLKSPFKSVIKISLLEQFIRESGKKPLLCNLFKEKWMNPGLYFELSKIDPYYILIVSLIGYYNYSRNTEAMKFIQLCFFLKTGISSDSDLHNGVFGFRQFFVAHCMDEWGWEKESVFKFGGFRRWQYDSLMKLSLRIEKYMIDTYKRVRHGLNADTGQNSLIKPEDKIALGRKMFVHFSNKPGKIKKIFLISKNNDHFQGLNLRLYRDKKQTISWELIHKSGKLARQREEILKKAGTIEEIGAWLTHNEFYSEQTFINLIPNSTPVTYDDIRRLFNHINEFFCRDTLDTGFNALLAKDIIISLFISINFCIPRNMKKIFECSLIYMNSWGEMFSRCISKKNGFDSIEELIKTIKTELNIKRLPEKTVCHYPKKFQYAQSSFASH